MVLSYLLEKEFKQTFRNRVILMMIVGFPVLVLLVLPWAVTFDLKDIRVAVVDRSRGEWAQRFLRGGERASGRWFGGYSGGAPAGLRQFAGAGG